MAKQTPCVICGGEIFKPGPFGRLTRDGITPSCVECLSLERHRVLRLIYNAIPDTFLAAADCLQFAPDPGAPRERFKSFELSIFGKDNHLNMMRIDRADGRYGWVIANHVIEHLANDLAGMAELMRIAGPEGIVQITVPAPKIMFRSQAMPKPDNISTFHYNHYGSDFPELMKPALRRAWGGAAGISATAADPSTGIWDVAYFFCASKSRLYAMGKKMAASGIAVLGCV